MDVFAINHTVQGKYDTQYSQTEFMAPIGGGKYANREQWVANYISKNGHDTEPQAHLEFNKLRMDAIQENYAVLQNLQRSLNGTTRDLSQGYGFSLPTVSKYVDTLNPRAAQQVFGKAYSRWEAVSDLFNGAGNAFSIDTNRIFGFDLETYGDIQNAKGIFGITEIGIGQLQLNGHRDIGRYLGKDEGYAAFAIAPNVEQQGYLRSVLDKMNASKIGYDGLTKTEQVVIERLSMYGGSFGQRFARDPSFKPFFNRDGGSYYTVQSLAPKNITYKQAKEGYENLVTLSKFSDYKNPLVDIVNYLTNNISAENDFIYGANSAFDFDGLMNVMIAHGGFTDDQFDKIRALRDSALDVTYVLQTAAAAHNMDVASFQEYLGANYAGATMEEQLKNYYFSVTQQHHAYSDTSGEGKVFVHHISEVFDKYIKNDDQADALRSKIQSSNVSGDMSNVRFYVKRGALDYTSGNEFGTITNGDAEKAVSSVSLAGQWWQIDSDRTGVIADGDDKKYVVTFMNSADIINNNDQVARATMVFKSEQEAHRRMSGFLKNSRAEIIGEGIREDDIQNAQVTRYLDIGRREIDKLLSPSDVRVNPGEKTTSYGYAQIQRILELRDALSRLDKDKTNFLLGTDSPISIQDRFSRRAANQLTSALESISGLSKETNRMTQSIINNPYQAESYLAINAMLDTDYDLFKNISEQVEAAFAGKTGPDYDVLKTIAFKRAYNVATSIANQNSGVYSLDTVKNGFEFAIDTYGVDLVEYSNKKSWRVNFSNGLNDAITGVQTALQDMSEQEVYNAIANPHHLGSLVSRGLLDGDQAEKIMVNYRRPESNLYMLSQEIAQGISSAIDGNWAEKADARLKRPQSFTDEVLSKVFHTKVDLNQATRVSESGEILETIGSRISDDIHRIASLGFTNVDSTIFRKDAEGKYIGNQTEGIISEILDYMQISDDDKGTKASVIAEMFENKKYSIGNFRDEGVQAFLIRPDQIDGKPHASAFMVLTNKEHAGNVIDIITNAQGTDTFSSFNKVNSSELAQHGAIIELPYIMRRPVQVDESGRVIASINTVRQGDSFERFILPEFEVYKDKVYFNDPDYKVLTLFRQGGSAALDHVLKGDFKQATRAVRKIFDELMEGSPASASYHGVNYEMHFNPNDEMRAYEVRLVEGVTKLFNMAATQEVDVQNLNPAQQIVADFIALQEGTIVPSIKNLDSKRIGKALESNAWQEFFKRHFVSKPITQEEAWEIAGPQLNNISIPWTQYLGPGGEGRYKKIGYDYDSMTFLQLTRKMAERADIDKIGHYDGDTFVPFIDSTSAKEAFKNVPRDMNIISMIGSESQLAHGSVFYGVNPYETGADKFFRRTFADYQPLSGIYNQMRPLYIQQGNPMTYLADEINTMLPTGNNTRVADLMNREIQTVFESQSGLISRSISSNSATFTNRATGQYLPIENIEAHTMRQISGQEHEFNLKVKHLSENDLAQRLSQLKDSGSQLNDNILNAYINNSRFGNSQALLGTDDNSRVIYQEIANAIEQDFGSIHEDKGLLSPALKQMGLFSKRDAATFNIDWSRVDEGATIRRLQGFITDEALATGNVVIHRGDVIGRRAGSETKLGYEIVNNKSDVIIPIEKFKQFIEERPSRGIRVETVGDIVDDKIMLFGLEKATTHSLNLDAIEDILRHHFGSQPSEVIKEEALRIATAAYNEISDGAGLILNPGYAKHGGIPALESNWNTIVSNYRSAGRLDDLATLLNSDTFRSQGFYDNMNPKQTPFSVDKETGRFITNLSQIKGQARFMNTVLETIRGKAEEEVANGLANDATKSAAINAMAEIAYNKKYGLLNATAHRQIMNDHMGRSMLFDLRMQQAIGMRNMTREDGLKENSLELARLFKEYAYKYDGSYTSPFSRDANAFINALNYNARSDNYERTIYNAHQQDAKRTLSGMAESYRHYRDNTLSRADISKKNIISISIEDLLKAEDSRVRTGIDIPNAELQETMFFIDGTPSNYLKRKARELGISQKALQNESFSLFIDLQGYGMKKNGKDIDGFLVPLQNMSHIEGDRTLFRESPIDFAKFIRNLTRTIKEGKDGSASSLSTELYHLYDKYINDDVLPQTNLMQKGSDAYKTLQEFIVPNSSEMLAQDEAPGLLETFFKDEQFQTLLKERRAIETEIANNPALVDASDIADTISKYNNLTEQINTKLKEAAELIKTDNTQFQELMTLGQSEAMKKASRVIDSNGNMHYGIAAGLNKEGFARLGLNISDVSRDILEDYQLIGGSKKFGSSKYDYGSLEAFENVEKAIRDSIQKLNSTDESGSSLLKRTLESSAEQIYQDFGIPLGHDIDGRVLPKFRGTVVSDVSSGQDTISQLVSNYIKTVQDDIISVNRVTGVNVQFSTKALNDEIAGRIHRDFRKAIGDDIGKAYLENVGIYADLGRFPIFSSQAVVKAVYDRTLGDTVQVRIGNPILSSLTNLDFDGDKVFLATMLNGTSLLTKESKEYKSLSSVYEDTIVNHSRNLLSEIIGKGGAFKSENPNDSVFQTTSLFRMVDAPEFENAAFSYIKKVGAYNDKTDDEIRSLISKGTIESQNPGLWFSLMHSSEVEEGYHKFIKDITSHEASEMAGITARFRKASIGYISTPGFRVRETLMMTLREDTSLSDSDKSLLSNLLLDLSNMDSKSGGLLSYAEQGAIDVKHLADTNFLSRAEEFARYTYAVLGGQGKDIEYYNKNFAGMIKALGPNVMPLDEISADEIARKYITSENGLETLTKIINKEIDAPEVSGIAEYVIGLSRMYHAVTEIPEVSKNFINFIDKKTYDALAPWFDQLDTLSQEQRDYIHKTFAGTAADPEVPKVMRRDSSERSPMREGQVVFVSGDIDNGFKDDLYIYKGDDEALFSIADQRTSKHRSNEAVEIKVKSGIDGQEPNIRVMYGDYSQSSTLRKETLEAVENTKLGRVLNALTLGDTDVYSTMLNIDMNRIRQGSGDTFADTLESLLGSNRTATVGRIKDMTDTYAYIMSQKGLMDENHDNTAATLLRELNEQIGQRQGKFDYSGMNGVAPLDLQYADMIQKRLGLSEQQFQDEVSRIVSIRDSGKAGQFSFDTYSRELDLLQKKVYDITSSKEAIESSYSNLQSKVDGLDPGDRVINIIKNIVAHKDENIASDVKWTIDRNYYGAVGNTQNNIYRAFENAGGSNADIEAMAAKVFNWDSVDQGTRLVGFGTYMGKNLSSLSAGDIELINAEADWMLDANNAKGAHSFLSTAIDRTRKAMEGFEPTATSSVFKNTVTSSNLSPRANNIKDATQVFSEAAETWSDVRTKEKQHAKEIENLINRINGDRMRQQTVSGSFFEQAKEVASKITAQQVAAGIAAMAGIGFVNKLLHDEHKRSPLQAGHSGAQQPPIINGQNISSGGGGAPSTPGFNRTVYHDRASGLDFQVSASTSQRLAAINGAKGIGLAGGGDTQVYAFNDTRGVSDNWLANKFAELSE